MKQRMIQLCLMLMYTLAAFNFVLAAPGANGSTKTSASYQIHVDAGWNLLSLPLDSTGGSKNVLYPTATSPAFIYQNTYVQKESLETGPGYWLEFDSSQTIIITGDSLLDKVIPVQAGWNMIGAKSTMLSGGFTSEPPGNITSSYYGYKSGVGYFPADTLKGGKGFWVKASQEGILIGGT